MEMYNPILIKEMRTRMRGKRAFLVLTGDVVTLSLILGLIFLVLTKNAPAAVVNQSGRVLTPVLIYVQMSLICLIAPTFSASAISSEREQQTFDLLIASLARPTTIVFGKVGAAPLRGADRAVRGVSRNRAQPAPESLLPAPARRREA